MFATEIISYIFDDEMNYFERLIHNIKQQLPGRLTNALLYFRQKVYNKNPFSLNLTMTEFASLIGTTRESVTRAMKEFQDSGIIKTSKNSIEITDAPKLEEVKRKG
ncbi:helix-turn-helix domain-containing protein [uncultured Sunxiuqinia sp.]|uniref:Crp/Fnr family transcriptional regulator n=1 Tax=uncultured Sunxiuqinia sp. TaxID=1573825 RepID=UPI002AA6E5E4|nr:helix-turn-helix domain-containing protein [uncultured Sunxiuqinia sp.]